MTGEVVTITEPCINAAVAPPLPRELWVGNDDEGAEGAEGAGPGVGSPGPGAPTAGPGSTDAFVAEAAAIEETRKRLQLECGALGEEMRQAVRTLGSIGPLGFRVRVRVQP